MTKATEGTTGTPETGAGVTGHKLQVTGTGLVLVVPVGRSLRQVEAGLRCLEELLQDERARAIPGGIVAADFWLVALRGAELRAGTTGEAVRDRVKRIVAEVRRQPAERLKSSKVEELKETKGTEGTKGGS